MNVAGALLIWALTIVVAVTTGTVASDLLNQLHALK